MIHQANPHSPSMNCKGQDIERLKVNDDYGPEIYKMLCMESKIYEPEASLRGKEGIKALKQPLKSSCRQESSSDFNPKCVW